MDEPPLLLTALKKQPAQPRARRTVERIIAATGELILNQGLEALTTNRVAEQANVNIATLYQYFPHKQALLSALLQTHMHDLTRKLNTLLEGLGEVSVEDSSRLWATLGIQYFRQNDSLLSVLIQSQQALAAQPEGKEFERRLLDAMHRFLSRQRDRLQVDNLDRAIYVALHACTGILSRHLLEPVPYYSDEDIVEEVAALMSRYFYGHADAANR